MNPNVRRHTKWSQQTSPHFFSWWRLANADSPRTEWQISTYWMPYWIIVLICKIRPRNFHSFYCIWQRRTTQPTYSFWKKTSEVEERSFALHFYITSFACLVNELAIYLGKRSSINVSLYGNSRQMYCGTKRLSIAQKSQYHRESCHDGNLRSPLPY